MNITFLLGNGFDIGFGLKSGYKSFYPYFIERASEDNIIGEWLKKYGDHLLIIYNYDPQYSEGHPVMRLIHANMVRDEFLNNTKLNDNDKKNVKSRIIIYDNQNIFTIQ